MASLTFKVQEMVGHLPGRWGREVQWEVQARHKSLNPGSARQSVYPLKVPPSEKWALSCPPPPGCSGAKYRAWPWEEQWDASWGCLDFLNCLQCPGLAHGAKGKEMRNKTLWSLNKTHRCWEASRQAPPCSEPLCALVCYGTYGSLWPCSSLQKFKRLMGSWMSRFPSSHLPRVVGLQRRTVALVCAWIPPSRCEADTEHLARAESFCLLWCSQPCPLSPEVALPYQLVPLSPGRSLLEVLAPSRSEAGLSLPHSGGHLALGNSPAVSSPSS